MLGCAHLRSWHTRDGIVVAKVGYHLWRSCCVVVISLCFQVPKEDIFSKDNLKVFANIFIDDVHFLTRAVLRESSKMLETEFFLTNPGAGGFGPP